jgi:hypothetical protein
MFWWLSKGRTFQNEFNMRIGSLLALFNLTQHVKYRYTLPTTVKWWVVPTSNHWEWLGIERWKMSAWLVDTEYVKKLKSHVDSLLWCKMWSVCLVCTLRRSVCLFTKFCLFETAAVSLSAAVLEGGNQRPQKRPTLSESSSMWGRDLSSHWTQDLKRWEVFITSILSHTLTLTILSNF